MTELSPAAQAVLFAWDDVVGRRGDPTPTEQRALAAALQAVADQVVPDEPLHAPASPLERGDQRWMFERDARQACRQKLLAIAAELKAHD